MESFEQSSFGKELEKDVFHLVTSMGQGKNSESPRGNTADPSSLLDVCHTNFIIDLAHCRVSVAQW